MSKLSAIIKNNQLIKHYQKGALRLLEIPHKDFFAYLSTLGGGMVNNDKYFQEFSILNSKVNLYSQSNQKIYKGSSSLENKIYIDNNSVAIFHNDANIFYENANYTNSTKIYIDDNSKFFYLDGGYSAYANFNFKTKLSTRIYKKHKLILNDVFCYETKKDLNIFFDFAFFYTILIKENIKINSIKNPNIILNSSKINDLNIVRILSNDNDIALEHINEIKLSFMKENNMN